MLDVYVQAFTVTQPTVLRRRLRPFSLGHAYLLEAGGNGYAVGGNGGSIDDLSLAVHVCTLGFRDGLRFIQTGEGLDAAAWADECAGLDLTEEARKFADYQSAALSMPERWRSSSESCRIPWQLQVLAGLIGEGSYDPTLVDRIMDQPLGESLILLTARQAWNGDKSIVSEDEKLAMAELDKHIAAKDKE